jgi:hypothetical protein
MMTLAISITALALSLAAFMTSSWRDRRDLMLRVHAHLTSVDQQRGRRQVYVASAERKRVEDLTDDEYVLINHAIAALNTLGIYYQRRYIPRKVALQFWAVPVLRLLSAAEPFLIHRDAFTGGKTWPELHAFADGARRYVQRRGIERQVSEAGPEQLPHPDQSAAT